MRFRPSWSYKGWHGIVRPRRASMTDSNSAKRALADVAGQMAGEYRLRRKIGEGGFGTVYEAEHPLLKRRAAVKVLHRGTASDSDAVLRFVSEAQAANQIRSRYIVDIFSFGKLQDGRHFYVMDLLHGEPLDCYLARQRRLSVTDTLKLLRPIAEALDSAHAAGIVHRDLKPQNIFLAWEPSGETVPKLLDFGLAKLLGESPVRTASGTPMGTPLYMSPEQALGQKVDGRSDVYALGVLSYQLLTGELPFNGESTMAVLMAHLQQDAPRASGAHPELPAELDAPLQRMLAKDPSGRPATAGAALAELRAAAELAGHAVGTDLPRLPPPEPSHARSGESVDATTDQEFAQSTERELAREALVRSAREPLHKRALGWAALALAIAFGSFYLLSTVAPRREDKRAESGATPGAVSAAAPVPLAAAPAIPEPATSVVATPAPPKTVEIRIAGVPAGARVTLDGKLLGAAPDPVNLPFGETPVVLTVSAAGFQPAQISVTPDRAQSVSIKLKKRALAAAPGNPAIPSDLESPF